LQSSILIKLSHLGQMLAFKSQIPQGFTPRHAVDT